MDVLFQCLLNMEIQKDTYPKAACVPPSTRAQRLCDDFLRGGRSSKEVCRAPLTRPHSG